jgi:agmatinase
MSRDLPKASVPAQGLRPQYRTFYGAPPCSAGSALDADVAFLGVPFDLGTTLRPGARFGPAAVRAASAWWQYIQDDGTAAGGWFDLELGRWVLKNVTMADCGDVEIAPADITANLDRITESVAGIVNAGSLPVIVGGDHSITYPALAAFAGHGPIHVVQFDTHQDFVDERRGTRLGHGNVIRRVSELPFVSGISQIGIRGLQKYPEPVAAARAYGLHVVTASAPGRP